MEMANDGGKGKLPAWACEKTRNTMANHHPLVVNGLPHRYGEADLDLGSSGDSASQPEQG
jgi:hypothetical protein